MDNFKRQMEELITLNCTYLLDEFINDKSIVTGEKDIPAKNIEELYELYLKDKDFVIEKIFTNLLSGEIYFNELILEDRDFLKEFNPKVVDLINHQLLKHKLYDDYLEWQDKSYNVSDFVIDDLITFCKFRNDPCLPITKHFFDPEKFLSDKNQVLKQINRENTYHINNSMKKLYNKVINHTNKGDFAICSDDGTSYRVDSFIIEEYTFFNNIINDDQDEIVLYYSDSVVRNLIAFLYGQVIIDSNIKELLELADYLSLDALIQICLLLLDDVDLGKEYKINYKIRSLKHHMKNMSRCASFDEDNENFFDSYLDDLILAIKEDDDKFKSLIVKLYNDQDENVQERIKYSIELYFNIYV